MKKLISIVDRAEKKTKIMSLLEKHTNMKDFLGGMLDVGLASFVSLDIENVEVDGLSIQSKAGVLKVSAGVVIGCSDLFEVRTNVYFLSDDKLATLTSKTATDLVNNSAFSCYYDRTDDAEYDQQLVAEVTTSDSDIASAFEGFCARSSIDAYNFGINTGEGYELRFVPAAMTLWFVSSHACSDKYSITASDRTVLGCNILAAMRGAAAQSISDKASAAM
ncbi:MAG: hypothetical protein ACTIJH_07505 [Moraxellaceae bacterium]